MLVMFGARKGIQNLQQLLRGLLITDVELGDVTWTKSASLVA